MSDFKTKEGIEQILRNGCGLGKLISNDDGPLRMVLSEDVNTPWYMIRDNSRDECAFWGVFINLPGLGKGNSFIPDECMNKCWKVVTRPRTLKEVFQTVAMIEKLQRSSKVGIELRETVHGLYGSYWYNRSLEEGKECYKLIRKTTDEMISPDVPVILKRGCTEYELGIHGDSGAWEMFEGQEEIEKYIKERVDLTMLLTRQTKLIRDRTIMNWIKFAYSNGDKTYLEYTNGNPLYPAYRTYH